jgi:hypothetical protein
VGGLLQSFSHTLGRFTVHWDQEVGQLAVTHKRYWCLQDCSVRRAPRPTPRCTLSSPSAWYSRVCCGCCLQRPVWETVPGVAFLSVADGSRVRFRSTLAGHFRVSSKPSLRTTVQVTLPPLPSPALPLFPSSLPSPALPRLTADRPAAAAAVQTLDAVEYNAATRSIVLSGAHRRLSLTLRWVRHNSARALRERNAQGMLSMA